MSHTVVFIKDYYRALRVFRYLPTDLVSRIPRSIRRAPRQFQAIFLSGGAAFVAPGNSRSLLFFFFLPSLMPLTGPHCFRATIEALLPLNST